MLQVIATIQLNPGSRIAFLEEFLKLVPLVQAEKGCLEYFPTVDTEVSWGGLAPFREDVVVVVEKWTDLEALKVHLTAPHMLAYRPKVKHLVVNVQLQVLTPVG